jgi:hypothetical protein
VDSILSQIEGSSVSSVEGAGIRTFRRWRHIRSVRCVNEWWRGCEGGEREVEVWDFWGAGVLGCLYFGSGGRDARCAFSLSI